MPDILQEYSVETDLEYLGRIRCQLESQNDYSWRPDRQTKDLQKQQQNEGFFLLVFLYGSENYYVQLGMKKKATECKLQEEIEEKQQTYPFLFVIRFLWG